MTRLSEIRRSRFVVADFTGHRGGVYFEAGFAMGLGLPVFWTCRKDGLAGLHFDVRQYNCIDWDDPADLATRLRFRIEAVIGKGPKR
jgi:nucleoside 2-deoxyribosyltransferase